MLSRYVHPEFPTTSIIADAVAPVLEVKPGACVLLSRSEYHRPQRASSHPTRKPSPPPPVFGFRFSVSVSRVVFIVDRTTRSRERAGGAFFLVRRNLLPRASSLMLSRRFLKSNGPPRVAGPVLKGVAHGGCIRNPLQPASHHRRFLNDPAISLLVRRSPRLSKAKGWRARYVHPEFPTASITTIRRKPFGPAQSPTTSTITDAVIEVKRGVLVREARRRGGRRVLGGVLPSLAVSVVGQRLSLRASL